MLTIISATRFACTPLSPSSQFESVDDAIAPTAASRHEKSVRRIHQVDASWRSAAWSFATIASVPCWTRPLKAPSDPDVWNRFHINDSWLNMPTPAGPRQRAANLPRTRLAVMDTPEASDSDVNARAKAPDGWAASLITAVWLSARPRRV